MDRENILDEHGNIETSLDYYLKLNLPNDLRVLDIGCRYGSLIYKLYMEGIREVAGIDVCRESIDFGRKKYPEISDNLVLYDGEKLPFSENEFDVVLMFDVIEHINGVKDFLRSQVRRVLKRGGLLILQTPNKLINVPWSILQHRSFSSWKRFHCSLQTHQSLLNLIKNSGFETVKIEKHNILTGHNKAKVEKVFGFLGIVLLNIFQKMPLKLTPNFWGVARKVDIQ